MNGIATLIAVAYGILGGVVVLLIGIAVYGSTTGRRRETNLHKLAEREKTWFGIVLVLLVALLFATIFFTPYGRGASKNDGAQVVNVTAVQFAFLMPAQTIKAGRPVEFRMTSKDVDHEFAVFDSHHTFLFQVQVIPGYTQLYRYTFHKAGTYTVECFEYCGIGHDKMGATFAVTA